MRISVLAFICLIVSVFGVNAQTCNCYVSVDSTFQVVPMVIGTDTGGPPNYRCNNCSSSPIALPFSFCFYGKGYDTVYINNKGSISFGHPDYTYSSKGLPAGPDTMFLGAFLADIDDRNWPSDIYYKITPTHMIVQWNTVGYNTFDDDYYDNFQVLITNGTDSVLPPGNNVSYCYWLMKWASGDSSGGSGGYEGIPAYVGVNKGDGVHYAQFGAFDYPFYTYYGPWDTNSDVWWLDNKSFTFNTCVTGNNIPPVIINNDSCKFDTICAGDTVTIGCAFLCPQQGQTAKISVSAPGLTGLTTDTSSANSIYYVSNKIVAPLNDTGTYILTITATDNGSPPLTNAKLFTITIKNCDSSLSVQKLANQKPPISLYPDPNNGMFTLQAKSEELIDKSIEVFNVLGEKVYSQFNIPNSTFKINLSAQPSGVYLYRVTDGNGNLAGDGKFVIQ
jgi:hypothetical protein